MHVVMLFLTNLFMLNINVCDYCIVYICLSLLFFFYFCCILLTVVSNKDHINYILHCTQLKIYPTKIHFVLGPYTRYVLTSI